MKWVIDMAKRFLKRPLVYNEDYDDARNAEISKIDEALLLYQERVEKRFRFRQRLSLFIGVALIAFSLVFAITILLLDYIAIEFRVGFSSIYLLILSVELLRKD